MKFTVAAFKLLAALATTSTCFAQYVSFDIVSPPGFACVERGKPVGVTIGYTNESLFVSLYTAGWFTTGKPY